MAFQAKFIAARQPSDYEQDIDALASEGYNLIVTDFNRGKETALRLIGQGCDLPGHVRQASEKKSIPG